MSNSLPLISVVIPVYNVRAFLDRCIASVCQQTWKNLEIIIVDDGSTDGSGAICDNYAALDERILVVHQKNKGLSAARNAGLDIATGEFYFFLDSDDYLTVDCIEVLWEACELNHASIAIGDAIVLNETTGETKSLVTHFLPDTYEPIALLAALGSFDIENVAVSVVWGKLYHRRIFDGIRFKEGALHEDEFVIHYLYERANRIAVVDNAGYIYSQRSGAITSTVSIRRIDAFWAFYDRYEFFKTSGLNKLASQTIVHACLSLRNLLEHVSYHKNKRVFDSAILALRRTDIPSRELRALRRAITRNIIRPYIFWRRKRESSQE